MIPNKQQLQSNYLQNKTNRNKYMVMLLSFNTFCVNYFVLINYVYWFSFEPTWFVHYNIGTSQRFISQVLQNLLWGAVREMLLRYQSISYRLVLIRMLNMKIISLWVPPLNYVFFLRRVFFKTMQILKLIQKFTCSGRMKNHVM